MRACDKDLAVLGTKLPGDLLNRSQGTSESHLSVPRVPCGRSYASKSVAQSPYRIEHPVRLGVAEHSLESRYNITDCGLVRVFHCDFGECDCRMDLDEKKTVSRGPIHDCTYLLDASNWLIPCADTLNFDLNPR